MVVPQSSPMLLTRNLLYTGITRAKKLLIIIGSERTVEFMIKNVLNNVNLQIQMHKVIWNPEERGV